MQSPKLSLPKLKANVNNFAANMNDKRLIQANLQMNGNAELKRLEVELKKIVEGMLRKGTAGLANDYDNGRTVLVERASGLQIAGFDGMIVNQHGMLNFSSTPFPLHEARQEIEASENTVPYFYSDIYGNVTIGVGHLVTDENAAIALHNSDLPLFDRNTNVKASNSDVKKAYNAVKQSPAAQHHTKYKSLPNLSAQQSDISSLLDKDINDRLYLLLTKNRFPFFDTYPKSIQIILADFAFQAGAWGTFDKHKSMWQPMEVRDWITAQSFSSRSGHTLRNTNITKLFTNVFTIEEPYFVTETKSHKLLTSNGN